MNQSRKTPQSVPIPLLALAAVWIAGFLVLFFQQTLPNNAPATRAMIWETIFFDFGSILNPFDYSSFGPDGSGWDNLPQRFPFVGVAAAIIATCWVIGRSITRHLPGLGDLLRSERIVLDLGIGISLFTLWVLVCGLAGCLTTAFLLGPFVLAFTFLIRNRSEVAPETSVPPVKESTERIHRWLLLLTPFALHIFLGGFTPPFDFDVREYHLQGPREWFEAGRIFNLDHNVYTTFPFLSEMLSLAAMVLHGDKWEGAISGKLSLTVFQFLSTLCAWAIARRWCGKTAAAIAALVVISTPWTTRISIIAYAEGAISFYIISSAMTALLAAKASTPAARKSFCGLAGFLAGSAMASKYPGVISAVIPVGLFLLITMLRSPLLKERRLAATAKLAAIYTLAVIAAVGPWLLKNTVVNHNPVYPLAYSVFGGRDWHPEMDVKWQRAHSATEHQISRIPTHLLDAAVRNDWQNGLLFAFAVPALLLTWRIRELRFVWLHATWILATWWALTHRIDRFWVPVIPLLGVASGAAWNLSDRHFWRSFVTAAVVLCSIYNYGFCRLSVVGFHAGLADMESLKAQPIRGDIAMLNKSLPESARVLLVGEAEVFDADFDLVYNTVFDDSIFEEWTAAEEQGSVAHADKVMKSPEEIRQILASHGITHIFVNWSEVLRYRLTYGFTEYVTPSRFEILRNAGIIDDPQILSQGRWDSLSDQQRKQILSWPAGETLVADDEVWNNLLLYPVAAE